MILFVRTGFSSTSRNSSYSARAARRFILDHAPKPATNETTMPLSLLSKCRPRGGFSREGGFRKKKSACRWGRLSVVHALNRRRNYSRWRCPKRCWRPLVLHHGAGRGEVRMLWLMPTFAGKGRLRSEVAR